MSFNLKFFRGDTFVLNVAVALNGVPVDLTGATLFFTAKRNVADTDAQALIALQTGAGITHTNVAGGLATIRQAADQLTAMPTGIPIYADVQLKTAIGEIFTVADGKITFLADKTLRTT